MALKEGERVRGPPEGDTHRALKGQKATLVYRGFKKYKAGLAARETKETLVHDG